MYFLSYYFVLFVRDTLTFGPLCTHALQMIIIFYVYFLNLLYYINLCVYLGPKRKIPEFSV